MAFKKLSDYNERKYGGKFVLRNDDDSADVIFLYRSDKDVLVADSHYIKSTDSGYVHCCGTGCPACAKGIRIQTKLFIPVYNITDQEVQIWDRNISFENQLQRDVFGGYPNPSDYVFRITRHGIAGSIDTTYEIRAIGKTPEGTSFESLCKENNISFPEYYENIIREVGASELDAMISAKPNEAASSLPNYKITPRGIAPSNEAPINNPTMPSISASDENDENEEDELSGDAPF